MCVRVDRTVRLTEEIVRKYAFLSGDDNPIHQDSQEAQKYMFQRPIAHGMLVMGFGAELVTALAGEHCSVSEYEMNFLRPVFVNDSVQLIAEDRNDSNWIEIRGIANGEKVVKGRARYRRKLRLL
ncbi:MaoC/PaaZ C-terminal domain-containing protein [Oceanobacillus senegalensis]|uniref:MaoC/PaaZ C-terminal domain-containing protein n=1 Tax=Oceanobacillus senegalensis TaxID=1936063 RepID=UPI000A313196|nr:MaoC/PaaZ C-terminal domain-containing protein [Oceanobacillus senegalensis]